MNTYQVAERDEVINIQGCIYLYALLARAPHIITKHQPEHLIRLGQSIRATDDKKPDIAITGRVTRIARFERCWIVFGLTYAPKKAPNCLSHITGRQSREMPTNNIGKHFAVCPTRFNAHTPPSAPSLRTRLIVSPITPRTMHSPDRTQNDSVPEEETRLRKERKQMGAQQANTARRSKHLSTKTASDLPNALYPSDSSR